MFKRYLYQNYRLFSAIKFRFSRRLTSAGWLVIAGLFLAAMLGLDTTLSQAYQTFSFLSCLFITGVTSLWMSRPRFSASRVLPKFGTVGEPLAYTCVLENRTGRTQRGLSLIENLPDPRPAFAEFATTPEPGEEKRNWYDRTYGYYRWKWLIEQNHRAVVEEHPVPALPPRGHAEVRAALVPRRRGFLRLPGLTVMCPDPFGFVRAFRRIPLAQSVLILPKRYSVRTLDLPGSLEYQPGGVVFASAVGESEEFVSLRDYRPGDSLRHIHWKSWAKVGKPIVKEFQEEFFVRHALILDTFSSTVHGQLFEEAVSVAASFACTMRREDSLLDLMFVGPRAYCFTAGRGLAQVEQMLEILASVAVCRDKSFADLSRLVLEHSLSVSGGICVLLAWDEERKNLIERLKLLGKPMLVFVIVSPGDATDLDPGPLRDSPGNFHVLTTGRIAEELAVL